MNNKIKLMFGGRKIGEFNTVPVNESDLDNIRLDEYVPSIKLKNVVIKPEFLESEGLANSEQYLEGKVFDVLFKDKTTGEIVDRIDDVRVINCQS